MITSPYNFVPLSEHVVMPFWANHVSHDIPFENGLSGVINLNIKAESPIYVRNGVFHKDNDSEKKHFNHFNNEPFIPASSIKGMLRSVLEIMSFGRMHNKVNDDRYSVRDFQNKDIYPMETFSKDINCGWLYKENGGYYLVDCGKPLRISHQTIQDKFGNGMADFFKNKANLGQHTKSAKSKYNKFPFPKEANFSTFIDGFGRTQCRFDPSGKKGTIVLTGQAGERYEPVGARAKGKFLEFVFLPTSNKPITVSETVIKNFFFAYYDHDTTQQKDDWKWRKPQLERGERIPVFFRREKITHALKDMGLSFLYKITYEQSIVESIKTTQKNANNYDLAETIFGYTEDNDSLKGRVHISHAFLKEDTEASELPLKSEVLSGPKASYYPNYVEQNHRNGILNGKYATFMDSTAQIRGWKRYPIRHNGLTVTIGTDNVKTQFIPLDAGAEFTFALRYHNLRIEELGALISAITFHNTEGVFHSIGMAKPLGYGKISLSIINLEEDEKLCYLKAYETFMDYALNHSTPLWFQSTQIRELFSMAKGSPDVEGDKLLSYMILDRFVAEKGRRQDDPKNALQRFSAISRNAVAVTSLSSQADIIKAKAQFQSEIKALSTQPDKEELGKQKKREYELAFKTRFEEKKNELLALLAAKKAAQLAKEKAMIDAEHLKRKEEKNTEGSQKALVFTDFDFEKVADVVKNHYKIYKVNELSEVQKQDLMAALKTSYQTIKNPKKDVWLKKDNKFNQFPWTDIRKWLGEQYAQILHGELVGK